MGKVIPDRGIVTLCDENYFEGLLMLHRSVRESLPVPVVCYDLGLTADQKVHAAALEDLIVLPLPDDPLIHRIRDVMGTSPPLAKAHKRVWPLWICPILIREAPFRDVVWMDCDLVVLRNLDQLFHAIGEGPVFTPENKAPSATPNKPALYEVLPIDRAFDPLKPTVNAGVSGWRLDRDTAALQAYIYAVERATQDPRVRDAISWHDQGALIWAIQSLGLEHRVHADNEWNLCVDNSPVAGQDIKWNDDVLDQLRRNVPNANVLHWNGSPMPWIGQQTAARKRVDAALPAPLEPSGLGNGAAVASYYDAWTDRYIASFGDTFQACRPTDVNDLHQFAIDQAELRDGHRILDAGCGICGPASFIASHLDVQIDAVTVSPYQVKTARQRLCDRGLQHRVTVHLGDFHDLENLFAPATFDRAILLESFSHSTDHASLFRGVMSVLKPGALVMIKDFFQQDGLTGDDFTWMQTVVQRVNQAFALNMPIVHDTVRALLDAGFEPPTYRTVTFENDNATWVSFNNAHQFDLYKGGVPIQWCQWVAITATKPL